MTSGMPELFQCSQLYNIAHLSNCSLVNCSPGRAIFSTLIHCESIVPPSTDHARLSVSTNCKVFPSLAIQKLAEALASGLQNQPQTPSNVGGTIDSQWI